MSTLSPPVATFINRSSTSSASIAHTAVAREISSAPSRREMVGLFSRISGGWGSHRRGRSEIDSGNTLSPDMEEGSSAPAAIGHGYEASVQFKPVEHPSEPFVHDQAVTCPLSEPSILNDGRVWKERRTSATAHATTDLPVVKDGSNFQSGDGGANPQPNPADLPVSSSSASAAVHEKFSTSDGQTSELGREFSVLT